MTTNTNPNIINEAKAYARDAIRETWPTAKEIAEPTTSMYEFDAICIDDETCPISSISIMHDPDADTFALVQNARPTTPPKEETAQAPVPHFDGPINWDKLAEDHAIAYLRGDLATSSPESYTIEEMRAISDGMYASTSELENAMCADFETLPPKARSKLLEMLCASGCMMPEWWRETLSGKTPDSPEGIA